MKDGQLLSDRNEAHRIIIRAARFALLEDELYKRSYAGGPLLKCVSPSESNYVLREVHEGDCGDHSGSRSLIRKVRLAGYFGQHCKMMR